MRSRAREFIVYDCGEHASVNQRRGWPQIESDFPQEQYRTCRQVICCFQESQITAGAD